MLLTYWNTVAFQVLYANRRRGVPGDGPAPAVAEPAGAGPLAALGGAPAGRRGHRRAGGLRHPAGRTLLAAYVDDLSNWYVRRSRRRFWDGDPAAFATLHECLTWSPG